MESTRDARVVRSRARVAEAVVALIVQQGLRAVTVDAVAATSGVAKTTIYRHWPSRQDLVADVLATALPGQPLPDTGSLRGDLLALARGLCAGLADPTSAALLAAIAFPDGDRSLDAVRAAAADRRHTVLRDVVRRAAARGEAVPADGAHGLVLSIVGPLFYRRFVEGAVPERALADRCVERALAPLPRAGRSAGRIPRGRS